MPKAPKAAPKAPKAPIKRIYSKRSLQELRRALDVQLSKQMVLFEKMTTGTITPAQQQKLYQMSIGETKLRHWIAQKTPNISTSDAAPPSSPAASLWLWGASPAASDARAASDAAPPSSPAASLWLWEASPAASDAPAASPAGSQWSWPAASPISQWSWPAASPISQWSWPAASPRSPWPAASPRSPWPAASPRE
jgi:hypothetical protein